MAVYDDQKEKEGLGPPEENLGTHPERREAEADDLQRQFDAPAAPEPEYGKDTSAATPDQLQQAEEKGDDQSEPDYNFNPNDSERRTFRQVFTRGRLVGLGVGGGLVAAVFSLFVFTSGPLQFIHLGQLLERFHFGVQEDGSDSRLLNVYKFAKNAQNGTLEKTRLGAVGRRVATQIDDQLSEIGITKNYTNGFTAKYQGLTVDQAKFTENAADGKEFKGLSREEFKTRFSERFNNTALIDGPGNTLVATTDEIGGYLSNRSLWGMLLEQTGMGKVTATVSARVVSKENGLTPFWHPLRQSDALVAGKLDEFATAWLTKFKDLLKGGGDTTPTATGDTATDSKGNTDTAKTGVNSETATQVQDSIKEAEAAGGDSSGVISSIASSGAGKVTISAVGGVTILCAAQGLAKEADNLKYAQVVQPLMRVSLQFMAAGSQIMAGKDVNVNELSVMSKYLNDPKLGSWANARSIQAENGQPLTGPDILDSANVKKAADGTEFTSLINAIPGIGIACHALGTGFGKVLSLGVAFVTAPITTPITMLAASTDAAKSALSTVVAWMAGSPVKFPVFGPDLGNYLNHGSRLLANSSCIAQGCVPLTTQQSSELKQYEMGVQKQEFNNQSFAKRTLDPYSPDSLISKAIDEQPTNMTGAVASIVGAVSNPLKVFSSIGSLFNHRLRAATDNNYDYGFPQFGYSLSDLKSDTYADPFDNATKAAGILAGPSGSTYIARAHYCFGVNLTADGQVTTDDSAQVDVYKNGFIDANDPVKNCTDSNPDWVRVRFFIFDTKSAEAADCFQSGDATSCGDVGFGGSSSGSQPTTTASAQIVGDIGESSDSVNCAPGTNDLGTVQSKYTGSVRKSNPLIIRLCQVPDIAGRGNNINGDDVGGGAVVNSRVSGAWLAAAQAAKKASVALSDTSSFRLNDSCGGTGTGSKCAEPGQSMHQLGVAIDFDVPHVPGISTTTCGASRTRLDGNPMWDWLRANAEQFGFKQYTYEVWHWDPLNSPSRCGTNQ